MAALTVLPGIAAEPVRTRKHHSTRLLELVAAHAILIAVAITVLMPILVIAATAFMAPEQVLNGDLLPNPITFENFPKVLEAVPFLRYFTNTVIIATLTTLATLLSSVPAAYALSTLRFPGRRILFVLVLAAMMLPGQVTVIPLYVMFAHLGWIGTPLPLLLPPLLMDAFSIFLLRQFFVTVPRSYLESARLDGASEWQILTRIFLPMVKSAIAAVALFAFFFAWNDYFNPLLYLGSNSDWFTLSVALANFRSSHGVEWNLMMAATLVFIAPVMIVFFFAQKVFVQGISLTGVKG